MPNYYTPLLQGRAPRRRSGGPLMRSGSHVWEDGCTIALHLGQMSLQHLRNTRYPNSNRTRCGDATCPDTPEVVPARTGQCFQAPGEDPRHPPIGAVRHTDWGRSPQQTVTEVLTSARFPPLRASPKARLIMNCFTCGAEDHLYRDCPERDSRLAASVATPGGRAASYDEHQERIDGIVRLWHDGKITMQQKRRAIADENLQWYGGPMTRGGISLTTA